MTDEQTTKAIEEHFAELDVIAAQYFKKLSNQHGTDTQAALDEAVAARRDGVVAGNANAVYTCSKAIEKLMTVGTVNQLN